MRNFILLSLLASFITTILADVDITAPSSGDKYSGSSGSASVKISWDDADDPDSPKSLANVKAYTISLCTGPKPDGSIQCLETPLVNAQAITSKTTTVSISNTLVPNGFYYFQIYAQFTNGGNTIHYSPRFQLTGMGGPTGTLDVTETGGVPGAQASGFDTAITVNSGSFTVPYTLQTGKTRFAPMQMQPGTTVTATTWSMKFPTSAVTYYSTKAASPVVYSTITPGWSYTAESAVNYASVAPYPTNWYAASERVSKATISAATKRRRWLD
ncbi:KRE9 Cell wall synthesis protein KRE9 [Candida maltosa Xu316]|uniref:Cell wall synthesis protein KRE9 n=1 Tax=Candida maltosa (strain Xu316) TaxID=1245528 RepID=M3K5D3_CANMX|nr:Cell wall synthesis protein KRE9 [Candida maltosa Xu316]